MRASFTASQLLRESEEVRYEQEVAEREGVVNLGTDFDFDPSALGPSLPAVAAGSTGVGNAGSHFRAI